MAARPNVRVGLAAQAFIILVAILLAGSGSMIVVASTPTLVPSPTPTNTLSFSEQQALATIAPPPTCGNPFTPCGALPWSLPAFPTLWLPSPTIMPTVPTRTAIPVTVTPSPTAQTYTPVPQPSYTPGFDVTTVGGLADDVNHVSGTLMAQSTQTVSINGTPQSIVGVAGSLGATIGLPFSYARALQLDNFAGAGGMITFLFLALAFIFLIEFLVFGAPIIRYLIDLILKVVTAIKPF